MSWWNSYYSFRRPLTISAKFEQLPANHWVNIQGDMSLFVTANKAVSDYSDVEVVYQDDSLSVPTYQVLPRSVDDFGVTFNLVESIDIGESSTGQYYLYYGNPLLVETPTRATYTLDEWPVEIQPDDPSISYTRPQQYWIDGKSGVKDAVATFSFAGTAVQVRSEVSNSQGIASFRIDSGPWQDVDLFSTTEDTSSVFTQTGLSSGAHTLQMKVTNRKNPSSSGTQINIYSIDYVKAYSYSVGSEDIRAEMVWNTVTSGVSSSNGVVVGIQGEQGPAGQDGAQGADGEVPDEELTQLDVRFVSNDFSTPYLEVDMGTAGFCRVRWTRVGRLVTLVINMFFDSDYVPPGGFLLHLHPSDLPYAPRLPSSGSASVGSFGYLSKAETSNGANDGYIHPLIPTIGNVGGSALLIFIRGDGVSGFAGGLSNLWNAFGVPEALADLDGAYFSGYITYEAATAA